MSRTKKKAPSAHSRSARRASPQIELEKSKESKAQNDSIEESLHALANRQGSAISKRSKQKSMTRQQRLRREKGMQRADIVIDKLEKKRKESSKKGKVIKQRSAAWDDLNGTIRKANKSDALEDQETTTVELPSDDVVGKVEEAPSVVEPPNEGGKDLAMDDLDQIS